MSHLARLRSDLPEFADLVRRGEPVIVEDIEKHPNFNAMRIFPSTRSFYVFPIVLEGQVLGAISLSFDKVKPLNPDHAGMLKTITSQVAVAIQRAQLLRDSQRLALEMTTLYDVGLRTGSTLSPSEVLRRTAASIEKLLNPDTYYIALYDPSDKSISFEVFVESGHPMPITRATLAEGGLTGRIVKTRKPLLVQDWLKDGTQYNALAGNIGIDMLSYLGVPMLVEDRVLGVISVQSTRPAAFTVQDERLLSALAAQTAMAYENARLHERAQEQAHLDSLTEVYNHGYFVELVRRATTLASRDNSQVALIMLDIDFFKSYNDQYGHVAGDNVLKLVAQAIKANVKATDSVGRWGGEEFGVLLPSAGAEEAQRVAARIRKAVLRLTPTDGSGNPIPSPTISQGISAFPDPSVSADSLIEQADAALYHAKFHGRDRLIIFEPGGGMAHVFPQALQTGELV
jgi:diguanylate cyclase (GGDEF)-like protein